MLSCIRIGFLARLFLFLLTPFLTHAQTRPEPLPVLDSLRFEDLTSLSRDLLNQAVYISTYLKEKTPVLESTQNSAQEQLNLAKADSTTAKSRLDTLSRASKQSKSEYEKMARLESTATKLVALCTGITEMDSLNLRKNLPKAWKSVQQLAEKVFPDTASTAQENREAVVKPISPPLIPSKKFAVYNPNTDVMLRPPTPPCSIASSSRDEFSGEISKEMTRAELFRYTNPALKAYLQGKTHVICEAALASTGTQATLHLTFKINDPNARKAFGRLDKNSVATLKFLDGSTFELQNAIADDGVFSADNDGSIFKGVYPLNPEAFKKIRKTGIDRIRILWSKGFDDYEVQQVDLLMRQAECLFK